jgi:hypothetical protein
VSDPTGGTTSCRCASSTCPKFCRNCDAFLGLDGFHVIDVTHRGEVTIVTIESAETVVGCQRCGLVAVGHGRDDVELIDRPWGSGPVRLVWRKRRWRCPEPTCPVVTFVEVNDDVAASRGLLTRRAVAWAVGQMRRENASVGAWPGRWPSPGRPCGTRSSRYSRPPRTTSAASLACAASGSMSTPATMATCVSMGRRCSPGWSI